MPTCTTSGGTPSLSTSSAAGEAHVLAELVGARPKVAAVAIDPGTQLEEARVLDDPAPLEAVGDLARGSSPAGSSPARSCLPSPLNGWSSELANQAMPSTMATSTPRAMRRPGPRRPRAVRPRPGSRPAATVAAVRQLSRVGQPVAPVPVRLRGHRLRERVVGRGRLIRRRRHGVLRRDRPLALEASRSDRLGARRRLRLHGLRRLHARRLGARRLRRALPRARGAARLALTTRGLPFLGRSAARIGRRRGAHSGAPARLRAR